MLAADDGRVLRMRQNALGGLTIYALDAGERFVYYYAHLDHYAKTLRAWVANLESNRDAAIAAAGETSYRLWRLYMAGSAQGFNAGRIGVYQSLLARPDEKGRVELPSTRRALYARS